MRAEFESQKDELGSVLEVKTSLKAKLRECKAKLVDAVAQYEKESEKVRSMDKENTSFMETSHLEKRKTEKFQERLMEAEEKAEVADERRKECEQSKKKAIKDMEKATKSLSEIRVIEASLKKEIDQLKTFKKNANAEKDILTEELEVLKAQKDKEVTKEAQDIWVLQKDKERLAKDAEDHKDNEQKLRNELKEVKALNRKAEADHDRMTDEFEALKKLKDAQDVEEKLKVQKETEAVLRKELKEAKALQRRAEAELESIEKENTESKNMMKQKECKLNEMEGALQSLGRDSPNS
jgi:chromosome segregation ATPase